MMPRACAAASASATGIAMRSASLRRIPCRGMSASRLLPRTYSITMKSLPSAVLDLVNRDDVRMIERGGRLRLLDESAATALVGDAIRGQHLNGNLAPEPWIAGAIDLAHAPGSHKAEDLVGAEPYPAARPLVNRTDYMCRASNDRYRSEVGR